MKTSKWILLYALLASLAGCVGSSSEKSATTTSGLSQSDKPELAAVCADNSCNTCATTCSSSCVQHLNSPVLTGSYNNGNVNFSWPAIGGATYYKIYKGTNGQSRTIINSNWTSLSYSDSGIYSNTEYTAQACNACGCGGESASYWTHYTPTGSNGGCTYGHPTFPPNFTGTVNGNSVYMTWATPSCGADYYKVYRDGACLCTGANGCGSSLNYNDANLANGTYQYAVQACNSTTGICSGLSPYITKVVGGSTTNPNPPTNPSTAPSVPTLNGSAASNSTTLNWTTQSGVTYYLYRYGWSLGTVTATSPYTDTSLTNGTTYYYALNACNSVGCSGWSSYLPLTPQAGSPQPPVNPVPATPTSLTSSNSTTSSITVNWPAVSGATYYILSRNGTIINSSATSPYTDTGLAAGTSYNYQVQACNASGCSGLSNAANFSTQVAAPSIPSTPVSLTSSGSTTSSITVNWPAVSGATYYVLTRNGVVINSSATSPFTDTGLASGTSYNYQVQACNASGCSSLSTVSAFSTQAAAVINAPTITASPFVTGGDTKIAVSWTSVAGAVSYKLYYGTSSSKTLLQMGSTTTFDHTGLTPNTEYTYYVEACNSNSVCSIQSTATTRTLSSGTYSVKINVIGRSLSGLTTFTNGSNSVNVSSLSNGTPTTLTANLANGSSYAVSITKQYGPQTCKLSPRATGNINGADVVVDAYCDAPRLNLNCAAATYAPDSAKRNVSINGTLTIPYTDGNTLPYVYGYLSSPYWSSGSTNNLKIDLKEGVLANGSGSLKFSVAGTPLKNGKIGLATFGSLISGSKGFGYIVNTNPNPNCQIKGIYVNK